MVEALPRTITDLNALEDLLSEPPPRLVELFRQLEGDILVLGAGGKMGPTLSRMAKRASDAAGSPRRVIAVSRFSHVDEMKKLSTWEVETIRTDLMQPDQISALPEAKNIIYMAGMKFGASGNEPLTWAMNVHLPAMICGRYPNSRIVAFSTGNVYGLSSIASGGSVESDPLRPEGDYAMSCVGRERIVQHFSEFNRTPALLLRLNYATELRYGVLVDLAQKVWRGEPISLSMSAFNAIWQGDANALALLALGLASSPAGVLNVTGPETLSVQRVGETLQTIMHRPACFVGEPQSDAILSNAQRTHRLFGYPIVSAGQMIEWVAAWVMSGGATSGKPTHFETRDGGY
jgi:dTDP-4-dehydrorhamnose reductase